MYWNRNTSCQIIVVSQLTTGSIFVKHCKSTNLSSVWVNQGYPIKERNMFDPDCVWIDNSEKKYRGQN